MTDLRDRAQHLITAEIAPAIGLAGDDIEVLAVADGIATVRLGPACAGCGGIGTVVAMLEQELRLRLPEVEVVEPIA
jgi:Fe-S cluster biogenesis protein NfuA